MRIRMVTYMITAEPYLDQMTRSYRKILVINAKPPGQLGQYVTRINPPRLSPFVGNGPCTPYPGCKFAFKGRCQGLMDVDDLPVLFNLVMSSGYTIDTGITKMMNKSKVQVGSDLLCFISG
jgi:hypothetical protein